jgi:hypothetical protein
VGVVMRKILVTVSWLELEKGPLRDYETGFCSLLALMVLEKICKYLAFLP